MKRVLSVLLASVLATSALADNVMVSYAAPYNAYPAGGPPVVHPIYSHLAVPYYAYPASYEFSSRYQDAVNYSIAIQQPAVSSFGVYGYAYNSPIQINVPSYGFGFTTGYSYPYAPGFGSVGFAYSMPANPNIPNYAFGLNTGYASRYAIGFDGTTPMAAFVAPPLENQLTTIADPYIERANAVASTLNGSAKLTMTVPADAVVSIQGEKTEQTGTTRTFITPALTGPAAYDIKVVRKIDGKENEDAMTVMLHPNQQSSISVLR